MNKQDIINLVKEKRIAPQEAAKLFEAIKYNTQSKETKESVVYGTLSDKNDCIAVIGMSGRFPKADNLDEYWDNLCNGVDCVSEITRWDMDKVYDSFSSKANQEFCRRGGLLENIDEFDAGFFEISPRQAEFMEPRQRLFLEEAWKTIEDAGYSGKEMSKKKCGVFVGCEGTTHYFDNIREEDFNPHIFLGESNSALAARISYLMDLKGPSVTIDTACSSSLVAIHIACESILSGDCVCALAGGITIMSQPEGYAMLTSMNMLSKEGKCQAFDDNADGFVPGEGVGVLLLKKLSNALEDNDHIYGIIRGSGINQDGKTNGLTAPSASSQTSLETDVYNSFNISPDTISYIETHGTGTPLGDTIEIQALKDSFKSFTTRKQFCGIGSVKTNIGHAAATSGVAGILKVLLAMKNNKLPKSLHFNQCNKNINFTDSPFYVITETQKWEKDKAPRRAAISSFGHSGTNCHMVIEDAPNVQESIMTTDNSIYVIPVSAKNRSSLIESLDKLNKWLIVEKNNRIENIAYTLQKGRNHYKIRDLFIVMNKNELISQMQQVLGGEDNVRGYFCSEDFENECEKAERKLKKTITECGSRYSEEIDYYSICLKYLKNESDDFSKLYNAIGGKKVSMPTYPFARNKYWLKERKNENSHTIMNLSSLIDENCSSFTEQAYSKTFLGEEYFIVDHNNVIPAVVYLEMVRQAAKLSGCEFVTHQMQNVVFVSPAIIKKNKLKVKISFKFEKNGISFEVKPNDENSNMRFVQGMIVHKKEKREISNLQIKQLISKMSGGIAEANNYYDKIGALGGQLGERFRGLKEYYFDESQQSAVIRMDVVSSLEATKNDYVIHPVLADAAIQGAVKLAYNVGADKDILYLPFLIENMQIINDQEPYEYAFIQKTKKEDFSFDIKYTNKEGKVLACIDGLMIRAVEQTMVQVAQSDNNAEDLLYYKKSWELSELESNGEHLSRNTLVFTEKENWCPNNSNLIFVGKGYDFYEKGLNRFQINADNEQDYTVLLDAMQNQGINPEQIIYFWDINQGFAIENTVKTVFSHVFYLLKALNLKHWKGNIVFALNSNEGNNPFYEALSGFANCEMIENPNICIKLVKSITGEYSDEEWEKILQAELKDGLYKKSLSVMYRNHRRYIQKNVQYIPKQDELKAEVFIKGGVYVITGGFGGLGIMFARELCSRYNAKVILLGRSALNDEKKKILTQIEANGGEAIYAQTDVTDMNSLQKAVENIKSEVNGVIHLAAVTDDSLLVNKELSSAYGVLAPKINGLRNLDRCFADYKLDFMIAFSSTTSIIGNVGQTDYGYANAFIDGYVNWMKEQRNYGHCISMIWPLWENGGLVVDNATRGLIYNASGMVPLSNAEGTDAFFEMALCKESNVIAVRGNVNKLKSVFDVLAKKEIKNKETQVIKANKVEDYFMNSFREAASKATGIKVTALDFEQDLTELGFDSIVFTELANNLNSIFKLELTPAFFFGKSNLEEIATNILEEYDSVRSIIQNNEKTELTDNQEGIYSGIPLNGNRFWDWEKEEIYNKIDVEKDAIAIIGMDCIMPNSENKEEFWDNLINQVDMISEIPSDRWDWKEYYGQADMSNNKTTVNVGGFMKEIDKFDYKIFHVSPKEAIMMDPQERLVLESVWRTLEDAGYKGSSLRGSKTGVFIGVTNSDYRELLIKNNILTVLTQSMVANRVSYFYDFHGPSEPVDTACSSSLTAINRAAECIWSGECDYAIAGGVNIIASPSVYVYQTVAGMLSLSGQCKSFDADADGYVRGEGVGTVLLKPLTKAVEDGDRIYAIIRGTGINHSGHGTSLTTPNPIAQAEVISSAYKSAGIPISSVRYIEAHGTGTKIGDPIEIDGLKKAFRDSFVACDEKIIKKNSIAIGSVKANIGHLESAAGISAFIKTVMSLQNKEILGVKGFKQLNPYINLDDSPFYIAEHNEYWEEQFDSEGNIIPRRAGISSFGIGGVNVHIVLEEYIPPVIQRSDKQKEQIFIFSASNYDILDKYVQNMQCFFKKYISVENKQKNYNEDWIEQFVNMVAEELFIKRELVDLNEPLSNLGIDKYSAQHIVDKLRKMNCSIFVSNDFDINCSINDICYKDINTENQQDKDLKYIFENVAYTLQIGREDMQCRVAFVATDFEDLFNKMNQYISGEKYITGVFSNKEDVNEVYDTDAFNYAKKWIQGDKINWKAQHDECQIMSLPNYPFERKHIWIDTLENSKSEDDSRKVRNIEHVEKKEIDSSNILSFLEHLDE
jgi:polyketide synthase PksN